MTFYFNSSYNKNVVISFSIKLNTNIYTTKFIRFFSSHCYSLSSIECLYLLICAKYIHHHTGFIFQSALCILVDFCRQL